MASLASIIAGNTGVAADQLGSIATQPEYLRRAAALFMRIDANSDGVLTRTELASLVGDVSIHVIFFLFLFSSLPFPHTQLLCLLF